MSLPQQSQFHPIAVAHLEHIIGGYLWESSNHTQGCYEIEYIAQNPDNRSEFYVHGSTENAKCKQERHGTIVTGMPHENGFDHNVNEQFDAHEPDWAQFPGGIVYTQSPE